MGEAGGGGSSGGGGGDAASRIGPDEKTDLAFKAFDKNQDGYITKNEMLKTSKNLTKRQVLGVMFELYDALSLLYGKLLKNLHNKLLKLLI